MNWIKTLLGPKSKYDRALPYTYETRVDALAGLAQEPLDQSYFSDTLCGLVELLADAGIPPARARLFAVYREEQTLLDAAPCLDAAGNWLQRPELCRSLEAHYARTRDARYRGHREHEPCSFEDRDRRGIGPY